MLDAQQLYRLAISSAFGAAIAYVYAKMTNKEDDQVSKYIVRAVLLVVASNLAASYFLDRTSGTEAVLKEPFYNQQPVYQAQQMGPPMMQFD
jgi:uncharacterized membrane protein